MPLSNATLRSLEQKGFTRRHIGRMATLLAAGASLPFYNEHAMAQDAERRIRGGMRPDYGSDVVRISSNENPQGPCKEGLEALYKVAPLGWRYAPHNENGDFAKAIAETMDVKEDYVMATAGSSDPLHRASCAFTSPTRSWVMANPGYGGGAPAFIGSKVVRVPLRDDYSHDVEAMIKADPNAGAYYVCNPNNPTGTLTARKDIEYLLANKKKDAVVVIDEAYIHFSDDAQSSADLVASDKDVIVLRTFSKIYGMAGLRAGFAIAKPDLLAKMRPFSSSGFLPLTGTVCATASLRVKNLVAERRAQAKAVRESTFEFLHKKGIDFIPSQANFFMMEVKRPGGEFNKAMADQKVIIGGASRWPVWPTKVRVTVGSQEDMKAFMAAVSKIMG
jgi:histidinol-phosphate aminotransferase